MSLEAGTELGIISAEYVPELQINLQFSDGFSRVLDFKPFLSGSEHPEIRTYLDETQFKGFSISYGNLLWNDYDLCFSIEDLYSGHLIGFEKVESLVAEDIPEYKVKKSSN